MAEFRITIEGMWTSKGKWSLLADRAQHIVPPKVQIKRMYTYKLVPRSKPTLGMGMAQSNHGAHWSLPMAFSTSHSELSIFI